MNKHLSKKGWNKMRQLLDSEMPVANRKPFLIWWLSGAAVATILIFSIQYWAGRPEAKELASADSTEVESVAVVKSELPINLKQSNETPEATKENIAKATTQSNQSIYNNRTSSTVNTTEKYISGNQSTSKNLGFVEAPTEIADIESQESVVLLGQHEVKNEVQAPKLINPEVKPDLNQESKLTEFGLIEPINEPEFESQASPDNSLSNNIPDRLQDLLPNEVGASESDIQYLNESNNEVALEKNASPLGGYLGLSSGINIVDPVSYVAQLGGGVSIALSQKWGIQIGAGLGLNGLRHQASIGLVTESSLAEDFQIDNTSGQSLPQGTEAAELSLTTNWYTYLHTGINYRCGNWSLGTGVDVAYRFGIQLNGLSQRAYDANAMPAQRNFTGSEIEELFSLYNRVDIRPMLSIGYMVHPRLSLDLVYRHGLNPLLKYPLSGSKAAYNRNIQLGLGYHF